MNKQICLFDKQYESLVERLVEKDQEYVLRTVDQRFFRLDAQSGKLLQRIEAGEPAGADDALVEQFVSRVLLGKGIYQPVGETRDRDTKQPKLAWHLPVLPARQVNLLAGGLGFLLHPMLVLPLLLVCIVAQGSFFYVNADYFSYDYLFSFTQRELLILLAASFAGSLFHELGHATACKRYAGKTGEIGIGFNVVVPVFFANVSNLYLVGRRQRLVIGISGIYFQVLFSSAVLILAYGQLSFDKYLTVNLISMLINTIPLYRNDGYWVLNDALGSRDILSETFGKLFSRGRLTWVQGLYACLFAVLFMLMAWLLSRFVFVRGPEIISQLIAARSLDFSSGVRLTLVSCQYLAIALGLYLLFKQLVYQPLRLKLSRPDRV